MKKILFITGALPLMAIVLFWNSQAGFSATELPNPQPTECRQAWTNYQYVIGEGFNEQLNMILDQPAPTSELVDDAFEAYRTYRCQLEYTCRAVLYSSPPDANPIDTATTGLTEAQLGRIPGCVPPEDIGLPSGWELAWEAIKTYNGGPAFTYNPPPSTYTYIPQCRVTGGDTSSDARKQYNDCLQWVYDNTCQPGDTSEDCRQKSIGLIKVEKALTQNAAEKKSRAMEEKLLSILNKLKAMESRAIQLKTNFMTLDQLLPCTIKQCT